MTDQIYDFFFRTYLPTQISKVLPQWKEQLAKVSEKAGQSLADPNEYKNLFPNFDKTIAAEKVLAKERQRKMPASMFNSIPVSFETLIKKYFLYFIVY